MDDDPLLDQLKRLPSEAGRRDTVVRDRLDLLAAEPDVRTLVSEIRRRIIAIRRNRHFIPYGRSFAYAHDLERIVTAIRERVLPEEPDVAFKLVDSFLTADARVLENVDDSTGAIGDVFRDACGLWLEAAARSHTPNNWRALFDQRLADDHCGVRGDLLLQAAILFSEAQLREMVADRLAEARRSRSHGDDFDSHAFSATIAARQLAIALRDPRLFEEATPTRGGALNDLQRIEIAQRYLEFGDPETALARLSAMANPDEPRGLELVAHCLERLGRANELRAVLETLFRRTLSKRYLDDLLALLPLEEHEPTRIWARGIALGFHDACTAATFLFHDGWPDDAEHLVIQRHEEMARADYTRLLDVLTLAENAGRAAIQVVCYRHLIRDILDAARSKAYGHAAKYYRALEALDLRLGGHPVLGDHAHFAGEILRQHGRKSAFWSRVNRAMR